MFRSMWRVMWTIGLLACGPSLAWAQGVLVVIDPDHPVRLPQPVVVIEPWRHPPHIPQPEPNVATYKIDELRVEARLLEQVARVQVSQTFQNTGNRQLEACFVFPLPYEGAIDQMTFLVDGREYPARLQKADEARRIYEEIVRRNRDPALLEWVGTGMFKTSVFPIPPGAKRSVSLRYSQLCRKSEGLTDFLFPLSTARYTAQPVENIAVRVTIDSQEEIKNVYSPTHPVEIKRPDERHATIVYESRNCVPASDFRLLYDVGKGTVSTRVLSYRPQADEDGYFLLLASPKIQTGGDLRQRKTVQFVVDRSGSMSGKKIEQVRAALKFVLNNLHEGDLFNIVAFDSVVETFRPELQRYNDETRKAALGFVEGIYAGGSTNIDAALKTAFAQLQDSHQPNYVFFLTDGLPTVGETNEMQVALHAKQENHVRARLFIFGVGYDVNGRLLDKLARESYGQVEYVRPGEDIEERISKLYNRVETPVLTDVTLDFNLDLPREQGQPVNRVYPRGSFDLFAGEQMVVVGRYKKSGAAKVIVRGRVGGQEQKFDFPAELAGKTYDESFAFVEKLWAVRRVGEILDEIDLHGKNEELIHELVELSTRHGILTPYTSFLADENTNLYSTTDNSRRASGRLDAMSDTSGYGGFEQRAMKQALQNAPADRPYQVFGNLQPGNGSSMPAATPAASSAGRGGTAYAGSPAAESLNYSWAEDAKQEAKAADRSVRNIGNRAFYRRNGQWIDSTVRQQQQAQAIRVKQFSDAYFDLARRHGRQFTQYTAFDEPVMVNVEGQAYLVEP